MSRVPFNRIAWLQITTILVLLLTLAGAGLYVWHQHQRLQGLLLDLAPRYARLAGLVQSQSDLQTLNAKARQQLAQLTYPATQDVTQAGNEAQQRIRGLFVESKLNIISIQVLPPPKEESKFDRIPIKLRVEGDLSGIQNALVKLAHQNPLVLLDSVSLQIIGAVKPASVQRLSGQFSLIVLRVRS